MAAASETPRPAEVVYTHVGVTTGDVFRVEDECFIDPALTAPWGWSVQVTNNLADVQAEGERFKLAIRWLNGKKLLPLRAAGHDVVAVAGESAASRARAEALLKDWHTTLEQMWHVAPVGRVPRMEAQGEGRVGTSA